MQAFKEKVADKLSRFLADSPTAPSEFPSDSPVLTPTEAVKALSKEEHFQSHRSLSSFLLSFIPTASAEGYKTNKRRPDIKPIRSLPSRWRSRSFAWRDRPLECHAEEYETLETSCEDEEDKGHASGRNISSPDKCEEATTSERNNSSPDKCEEATTSDISTNYLTNLMDKSSFISPELYEFLHSTLPNIVKGCQWVLLYSTSKHGISLRTLLRKSFDLPGPCLLIVGDTQGAVFGGLLDCPLIATSKRKYQGTNQSFVFTTIYGQPRLFRATGANRFYYICLNDLLALGGGGNFALCLDGDLLRGTSGPSETFGNMCLAHSPEFELKNVELWGFTHSSQYNT